MIQNIIRCLAVGTECLNNWETFESLVDKHKQYTIEIPVIPVNNIYIYFT